MIHHGPHVVDEIVRFHERDSGIQPTWPPREFLIDCAEGQGRVGCQGASAQLACVASRVPCLEERIGLPEEIVRRTDDAELRVWIRVRSDKVNALKFVEYEW